MTDLINLRFSVSLGTKKKLALAYIRALPVEEPKRQEQTGIHEASNDSYPPPPCMHGCVPSNKASVRLDKGEF